MFKYLKSKIHNNNIKFLQETNCSEDFQNEWYIEFKGQPYFSQSTTNSCDALIWVHNHENFFC